MSPAAWIALIAIGGTIAIAFGYLPARTAARKGYSLRLFWVFGTIALIPAVIVAGRLRDRTGSIGR